ncbi:hypothetical protein [Thermomonas sp.]|uniref:hypothetical protein n=1 Tax=Thermomonas sp. TaxID=1971895 RepID=UPI002BA56178|nr:hypothetical protein [Thermomonas sp.]HRO64246.1 hypothetical protein [Thermomonas sp.]
MTDLGKKAKKWRAVVQAAHFNRFFRQHAMRGFVVFADRESGARAACLPVAAAVAVDLRARVCACGVRVLRTVRRPCSTR